MPASDKSLGKPTSLGGGCALFAEACARAVQASHIVRSITAHPPPHLDGAYPLVFGIRGELWLTGPGKVSYITASAREAVVTVLAGGDCPLTAAGRALGQLMRERDPAWHPSPWRLHGRGTTRRFAAAWHALDSPGGRIAEARLARGASCIAGSRPIPAEAPVTRTVPPSTGGRALSATITSSVR